MVKEIDKIDMGHHLSNSHHMKIQWEEFFKSKDETPAKEATLVEKASIVGRVGLMILSCGTGSWRVRDSMNTIARALDITCSADIGLLTIDCTCFDVNNQSYSQTLTLPSTGVNMTKLNELERFVRQFEAGDGNWNIGQIHRRLGEIEHLRSRYTPVIAGLAAAIACAGFIFLLGGGIPEIVCAFFGAGCGNYTRMKMGQKHITMVAKVATAVFVACVTYFLAFQLLHLIFNIRSSHIFGYIGSMLFVIPGFPFITAGLDLSKLDMRSGLERMAYALLIIIVATTVGWATALLIGIHPGDMTKLGLNPVNLTIFRLIASFCGVFGFSLMFNSKVNYAALTAVIGAISNTLRLSLVDYGHMPPALAAFIGVLLSGLLASFIREKVGYPRIAITVPSVVIMVPGLYMYRAVFNLGLTRISLGAYWATEAIMIVIALPLGLIAARILTDSKWRHAS
ncbi:threonine/serine exporter family protein [Lactobacillus mulieris]|uniref:Threonine/serine exporter family protein n=1 Tax=Lactobacillus mulieris TaxID=2508708 RepID=A0AAW5WWK7_9LACO|nr:threonine/serine exporter family protein [Lactobacillus mulieris]MCZ3621525.1 threonine/serine exporter family protein [Lactobacillus mulieris]MCZ3623199.1 threonine/serine exporter family protein [Lactobacillus mulieris]MCZ3635532.1 threonine/serine exporter family protein [Lactobacillus mulieris]MCZ3689360.1 threonine/serine exporter family protein [Lactobacillus mulieris]MCZ3695363.1 threonine/serine exporter family protein [Lactobacillus mulieris]